MADISLAPEDDDGGGLVGEPLRFEVTLPAHPVSVAVVRAMVRALGPAVAPQVTDNAELLLSELVTNSIRHGSTSPLGRVAVELLVGDGRLSGSVCDHGPPFDRPATAPEPGQTGGFGLYIADALGSITIERTEGGNRVRFDLPTPGA